MIFLFLPGPSHLPALRKRSGFAVLEPPDLFQRVGSYAEWRRKNALPLFITGTRKEMEMFYIYSNKGWLRNPTKTGNHWGSLAYAISWKDLNEAKAALIEVKKWDEYKHVAKCIMRVEQQ